MSSKSFFVISDWTMCRGIWNTVSSDEVASADLLQDVDQPVPVELASAPSEFLVVDHHPLVIVSAAVQFRELHGPLEAGR